MTGAGDPPRPTVALVTGGGRGIGRTLARELTRAGWRVVVSGRTAATLDATVAAGEAARAVVADATDAAAMSAAVRVAQALGPLDLVVAGAGAFTAAGPIWETDPDQWWRDVEVNLRGPALALHAALPDMVARGTGRVVVLGSGIGVEPTPWASAYSASKAAVMRLVDSVAGELLGTGVCVFAISPGLVDTDMTDFPPAFVGRYADMQGKAAREGRPAQECAELVLALASGRFDALSGRYLHVRNDPQECLKGLADHDVKLPTAATVGERGHAAGTLRLVDWPRGSDTS